MPSSRYFAVAGPNDRVAQVARRGQHGRRVGGRDLRRGPHRDGLEELRPEHGAEAAAAGMAAVVRDRRVPDQALARRPDRGHAPRLAEPLAQARLGLVGREAPEVAAPAPAAGRRRRRAATDGSRHAPRTTIASWPVSLPAIAKWLEASASLSIPVSGDLATTANLALVVSGVPTSGEKQKASGASGASGSTPGGASSCISHAPRPAPPMYARRTSSGSGRTCALASATSTTSARPKYPPATAPWSIPDRVRVAVSRPRRRPGTTPHPPQPGASRRRARSGRR